MIALAIFVILVIISLCISLYINISLKSFKTINNKREMTGCELAHEIIKVDGKADPYILLTKNRSEYNSLRDSIKLDEDTYDEYSVYSLAVSALRTYESIDTKNKNKYKSRDSLSKIVFYMVILSYILIVASVLINMFELGVIAVAIAICVSIYDLYFINIYKNNLDKIVKLLLSNGFIDKDEKDNIYKVMSLESLSGLTRLFLSIIALFDSIIPSE